MTSHDFTLILAGVNHDTPGIEDAIFEAGCDDATVCSRSGTMYLLFAREATDIETAIQSAIEAIEGMGLGATVVTVEPSPLVTLADIAERLGVSLQYISQIAADKNTFPGPVAHLASQSPLWSWLSVAQWQDENGRLKDKQQLPNALSIEKINKRLPAVPSTQ